MAQIRLKYVQEFIDRHGKVRRYVRRPGFPKVSLPGLPGSAEFMAAYQAAVSGLGTTRQGPRKDGTIGKLIADFYRSAEFSNLKPSSQATYRFVLSRFETQDGHRLVRDLPRVKARKIIEEIGETKPGLANLTKAVLHRLFEFAVSIEMRSDNPFTKGPAYKLNKIHTWTDAEIAAYEKRWPFGTRERLAYSVLLYTAQRVSDAVTIKLADARSGRINLTQKKTGEEVSIAVHPELARAIKAGPCNGMTLIGTPAGKPINRHNLSDLISRAAAKAGLPAYCVAHGLRKAALRRLAEHGSTTKEIQAVSGHRTLKEIERYTEKADRARLSQAAIRRLPDKKRTRSV